MINDEDELNEESLRQEKRREKTKEQILDETFKKAELLKGKIPKNEEETKNRKTIERPFFKSGILLIIIVIVALTFINYSPWMYIKYETNTGMVEEFFYNDFDKDFKINEMNQTVRNLFSSPCTNCSNNSQNFIGLTFNDLSDSSKIISDGFIVLAVTGVIFTIFVIIDRFRRFSDEIVLASHSLFFVGIIILSLIILITSIKFIGAYFLLYYNWPFIEISGIKNPTLVFLAPIIIIIIALIIIRAAIMMLKINFREMENKFNIDKPERPYSTYRYGSNIE